MRQLSYERRWKFVPRSIRSEHLAETVDPSIKLVWEATVELRHQTDTGNTIKSIDDVYDIILGPCQSRS